MELPSLTKTWHKASYPAIAPSNPALSAVGKIVFITGGGAGIGLATAHAFAAAGASTVAISGRTEKTLSSAKEAIESAHRGVKVLTFVADVTDQKAVDAAFSSVGKVDILVHNAGYLPHLVPIAESDFQDWWSGMEINVKGAYFITKAFLKVAASDATIVDLTTGLVHYSAFPGYSAYMASKVAEIRFFDCVQTEHPELHVVHIQPGVVATDMGQKAKNAGANFPMDHGKPISAVAS